MPFKFTFDIERCIQCGICADVCPVNTLDYTRALHKNIEDSNISRTPSDDMTEYPIQVNRCIGCMICPNECPVQCITIESVDKEPKYAPVQGPMMTEEASQGEMRLSKYTKIRPTKFKSKDVWGKSYTFIPKRRKSDTETWEGMDARHEGQE